VLAEEAEEEAKILVEDSYKPPENAEKFKFEAEVSKMLDIVVNSLYQNKDVFLRELISNASDALDKIRFLSISKPEFLAVEEKLQVQIEFDREGNTLTVRDTGIGMTHDDMISNLGTVARSGTTRFMQALKESGGAGSGDISQIGQFGVGFYSAFLVADRIQVASKHPEADTQYIWTSTNGASEFQIFPDPRGNTLARGTEITLFLKEDCMEYADEMKLQRLAQHYSEFVQHPIFLRTEQTIEVEVEDEEEETDKDETKADDDEDLEVTEDEETEEKPKKTKEVTTFEYEQLNGNPAIWTRSKDDISDDEYQNFYKVVAHDEASVAQSWSHFEAEGNINFKSLLFLPDSPPKSWTTGMQDMGKMGLSLYVRKVLISDEFELLPRYLSFLRGVIDSDDLPLNVNRETLQESKIIQVIKKKVVRKALEMIRNFVKESDKLAEDGTVDVELDEDGEMDVSDGKSTNKYNEWYSNFAPSLKMGAIEDEPNRGKIMKLLRFKSSKTGEDGWVSFEQYLKNMKEWQNEIYYVAGQDEASVKKSQFLESFTQKDVEVLYFTDPIDEYMAGNVREFDGKSLKNIATENIKLKDEDDADLATRREKFYKLKFRPLTKWLKKLYGSSVMRVAISNRLVSTPAIASSAEYGHSANMERIMRAQAYSHGQSDFSMRAMKVFEINPRHPLIIKLLEGTPPDDDSAKDFVADPEVEDAAWMLHEMAMLDGGFPLSDPEAHSKRMMKFIQSTLSVESLDLEAELDLPEEEDEAPEDAIPMDFDMDDFDINDFAGDDGLHIEL
jgi:heat shock protein beta